MMMMMIEEEELDDAPSKQLSNLIMCIQIGLTLEPNQTKAVRGDPHAYVRT